MQARHLHGDVRAGRQLALPVPPAGLLPLTVLCVRCGAEPGDWCVDPNGEPATAEHAIRLRHAKYKAIPA